MPTTIERVQRLIERGHTEPQVIADLMVKRDAENAGVYVDSSALTRHAEYRDTAAGMLQDAATEPQDLYDRKSCIPTPWSESITGV